MEFLTECLSLSYLRRRFLVCWSRPQLFVKLTGMGNLKANTPGIENVIIPTHCQNDLGVSIANIYFRGMFIYIVFETSKRILILYMLIVLIYTRSLGEVISYVSFNSIDLDYATFNNGISFSHITASKALNQYPHMTLRFS